MRDLPESKYDENGRPIKGKKPNNSSYKNSNESNFLGEGTKFHTRDDEMSIYSKKPVTKQHLIFISIFCSIIFFMLLFGWAQDGFNRDGIYDILVFLILLPMIFFSNYYKYKNQVLNGEEVEVSLFKEEDNEDLVDKVDADLLEEGDFDANKADKIIEEFNR